MYKHIIILIISLLGCYTQAQNKESEKKDNQALGYVYDANALIEDNKFVEAEMAYRKAVSKAPNKAVGAYNLSHSYYKEGNFDEALFRAQEAGKNAKTKEQKHKAFHNIGNMLMKNKMCKEAVEAFKSALRNNPNDDETRYNLAVAKKCAEDQKKDGGGEDDKKDKDKKDEQNKEDQEKKEDENKDKENKDDKGDKDKKDGEDKEDEKGKPKDDKKNEGQPDKDDKNKKKKPRPGQMSPQQMKNILEAMQNQEQKVQQKINAEKQKGAKVKTKKDW